MRAFVDRHEVDTQDVELDRVRWEQGPERMSASLAGRKTLYVELVEADLLALGRAIHRSFEKLRKDPEFFEDEMMEDVPRPASERQFVEKPLSIKRYLKPGSFWRSELIRAVMTRMNPWGVGEALFFIEQFKDVRVDPPWTILIFEARARSSND